MLQLRIVCFRETDYQQSPRTSPLTPPPPSSLHNTNNIDQAVCFHYLLWCDSSKQDEGSSASILFCELEIKDGL